MSARVNAADVAPSSDSKSHMIPYVVLFFPASAAESHLYHVQDGPSGHVV